MFSPKLALRPDHPTNSNLRKRTTVPVAVLVGAALSVPLHAQTIPWTNAAGGNFNTIANWNSGAGPVPVAANTAQFNIANTYTTTFNLSPTNAALTIGGSNVSFRPDTVASRTYTITGNASITGGSLTLAAPASEFNTLALNIGANLNVNSGRSLTVSAGNDVSCASFDLATTGAGISTTTFDGNELTTFTVTGPSLLGLNGGVANLTLQNTSASFGAMTVANSGVAGTGGNVRVQGGADITALGNLSLGAGTQTGQVSTFTVTGSGSTVVQTGAATMTIGAAANSSATLDLLSTGLFTTGTGLTTVNKTGLININAGTLNANGNITLNGGTLTRGSTGSFNWADSKTMTVQAGGAVNFTGSYVAPNAATINLTGAGSQFNITGGDLNATNINVNSGATLSSTGFIEIGTFRTGAVVVDGTGSTFTANSGLQNSLGTGGFGTLTLQNNATGTVPAGYRIGFSTGSDGTLNVLSGATLSTGSISIANSATTATGSVNVTGGTLTQTGISTLTVGASSLSTATVTVGTSGIYTTGTGLTTINKTGQVNIAGGILNANGNITLNGGTLTRSGGTFNWADSKTMNVQAGGAFNLAAGTYTPPTDSIINLIGTGSQMNVTNGSLRMSGGAIVNVSAGAALNASNFIDIGTSGSGTVVVDGVGSSITAAAGGANFLGTLGEGTLTLRNSATGTIPGGYTVGFDNGSSGTLNVLSGASLTTGSLVVATATATATGNVNVNGGTLTQTGTSTLTVGALSLSTATVTVGTSGIYTTGTGTTTVNLTGLIAISGGTFNANGNLTVDGGTLNLTAGGTLTVAPGRTTTLGTGGVLNITDSTASLGTLTVSGGALNFNSGSLSYTGNLTVGTGGLLGNSLTLDFSRALTLTGTTTINPQHQIALTGGSLTTANIVNNGTFNFASGTLSLTSPAGITIGSGGPLGSVVSATAGRTYNISGPTTISSTGILVIGDGTFNPISGISNSGEIKLTGLAPVLSGAPILNSRLIRGDGRIDNNISNLSTGEIRAEPGNTLLLTGALAPNAGRINLQGGTIQFTQAFTNAASGRITGTGFLYADSSLTNLGDIQFSAGFTSVYGPVTNNNKITVSGGGTATFYDSLIMSPGSTFQTSTNSTSVFFGPVTGTGSFTGPGVKIFEAGGPGSLLGAIATISGTTRVGPGATVEAGSFHEASVLIEGTLLLTPNLNTAQNTSRTSFLQIDPSGLLELTDNSLLVDYSATSPISTLISYFTSGQLTVNGDASGLPTYLAISEAADLGLTDFNGIAIDDTAVVAKFTYVGDANLDGQVDALDYERVDLAIGNTGALGTAQGDLNYDGTVDALDYEQIDLNIGNGVGSPLAQVLIPEPTLLAPLAALMALHPRRPRR